MKKSKYFLVDLDNVTLNWTGAMYKFIKDKHPEIELDCTAHSFGLQDEIIVAYWKEFNQTEEFLKLKPYRQAEEFIPKLAELGYKFIGISSALTDNTKETLIRMTESRSKNLEKFFPGCFEAVLLVENHKSKKPYLSRFTPTFYVDDKAKHVYQAAGCGHTAFLMDHNYNKEDKVQENLRVKNWADIYNYITTQLEN